MNFEKLISLIYLDHQQFFQHSTNAKVLNLWTKIFNHITKEVPSLQLELVPMVPLKIFKFSYETSKAPYPVTTHLKSNNTSEIGTERKNSALN